MSAATIPSLEQRPCPTGHAAAKPVSTFDTVGADGSGSLYCTDCASFVDTDSPRTDTSAASGAATAAPAGASGQPVGGAYVRVGERGDLELVIPLANILTLLGGGGDDARD